MTVEVNVVRTKCGADNGGLSCTYCYQGNVRKQNRNDDGGELDFEKIEKKILANADKERGFTLFGGEPMLGRVEDLERLWKFGHKHYGHSGVQTSGRPVTAEHLDLMEKYNVHLGVSIDGPEECNDARWAGTLEKTREATAHSIEMLHEMLKRKPGWASIILTLSTHNAGTEERLDKLVKWLIDLDERGMFGARIHVLEIDNKVDKIGLTHQQNYDALLRLFELETKTLKCLKFDLFKDMLALLRNPETCATCNWSACDPWYTQATHGIEADGSLTLCQRGYKDGEEWEPTEDVSQIRQLMLATTPQADGGCKDCRFMTTCKGQCPGTAIDGDWRNRTRDCELWFKLFAHFEDALYAIGEVPKTRTRENEEILKRMMVKWSGEGNVSSGGTHGNTKHGDHTDHGDHGDLPALKHGEKVVG